MEIYVKNIKLINNSKAIVKSKWCNDTVKLNILVSNEWKGNWMIFKGECTAKDIIDQCESSNVGYEEVKNYLTLGTNVDGIMYDMIGSDKFIVFKKEYLGTDSEGYVDVIYFKLKLDCEEISMDILLEQISDIKQLTSEISRKNDIIKKDQENIKKVAESYETLLLEKQEFEKKFYSKVAALLNTKKQFIQENIHNKVPNLDVTHAAGTSDDLMANNKKLEDKLYSSPSRTSSKRHSSTKVSTTPKRTPIKAIQRTPSKRLREIQDMSDSDDSFTVLSCDVNKKFSSKTISDSLDTSRVFKDFKIKTPIKHKEDKRESSVELKIDRNTNELKSEESENERKSMESKASNHQNAQRMEAYDDKSQELFNDTIVDDEEIPCSQESQEMTITSFSERLKLRNMSKKLKTETSSNINPYDVDTVNILNISD